MAVIISASKEVAALRDQLASICDVPLSALELSSLHIALEPEGKSEISWTVGDEKDGVEITQDPRVSVWEALCFYLNIPDLRATRASLSFLPSPAPVEVTITFHPQADFE